MNYIFDYFLYKKGKKKAYLNRLEKECLDRLIKNAFLKKIKSFLVAILKSWQRPTFPPGDPAVLSAMKCLTSRFGMGLGISTSL